MNFNFSLSSDMIVPVIFCIIGIAISISAILKLLRGKRSLAWSSTTGFVKTSEVAVTKGSKGRIRYTPEICYTYTVQGIEYFSDKIDSMGLSGSYSSAEAHKIASQYPKDRQIMIYYNPGNPADSVIEPGIKRESYFLLAFGILFFALSVVFIAL